MPYITPEVKLDLNGGGLPLNPGDLNYLVTLQINKYLKSHTLSYQTINDIIGALEGAKAEFYRRIAVPYENSKLSENGDVYEIK